MSSSSFAFHGSSNAYKSLSGSSCAMVASSSTSVLSSIGSSGSCMVSGCGSGGAVELDAGVACVRCCFGMCVVLLSLVPDFTAARLSPRGDLSCCGVVVPVVDGCLTSPVVMDDIGDG